MTFLTPVLFTPVCVVFQLKRVRLLSVFIFISIPKPYLTSLLTWGTGRPFENLKTPLGKNTVLFQ